MRGIVLKHHPDGAYCQVLHVENSVGYFSKIRGRIRYCESMSVKQSLWSQSRIPRESNSD